MKVPYFDIRSHFLLWMILSKVFSMYINADSQSAMLITEARWTGGKICPDYTLFSLPVFHKKSALRAMEIQVYWDIFEESTAASRCRRVSIKCI